MRRAPLAELPLEHFMPTPMDVNNARGSEKQLPAFRTPFTPAKWRIFQQEGITSPPNAPHPRKVAPAYFHVLAKARGSLARRLDFRPDAIAPSSFAGASRSISTPARAASSSDYILRVAPPASPAKASALMPPAIAQDGPSLVDRSSVHYPGFDVHQDIYTRPPSDANYGGAPPPAREKDAEKENRPPRRSESDVNVQAAQ